MLVTKIITGISSKMEARKIKKAKIEELAQDMSTWLPPYGYGIRGKIERRAVQIIKQREHDELVLQKQVAKKQRLEVEKRMGSNYQGADNLL